MLTVLLRFLFVSDSVLTDRYEEYPKLKRLVQAKDEQVSRFYTPPYALRADLRKLKLDARTFGTKFDVILIDPPWEEYVRRAPGFVNDTEVRVVMIMLLVPAHLVMTAHHLSPLLVVTLLFAAGVELGGHHGAGD